MNVKLTHHAEELLEAVRASSDESIELILEHALETFVREQKNGGHEDRHTQEQAVREMLDFVNKNRVKLGIGTFVKDLIREGQRL
jgi:hypothetical protein